MFPHNTYQMVASDQDKARRLVAICQQGGGDENQPISEETQVRERFVCAFLNE